MTVEPDEADGTAFTIELPRADNGRRGEFVRG
ncbi:hypothetical protein P3T16_004125 [Paraburkholderia sp. GAS42]